MNARLRGMKQFRNPTMYEKLVEQMDINECGSNCSPDQYDPNRWAPEDYYDKLCGNFDYFRPFLTYCSRITHVLLRFYYTTPHAPCDMRCVVPMCTGC